MDKKGEMMAQQPSEQLVGWELIPDEQWEIYQRVIRGVREQDEPFALGGAFALAPYTGQFRNTKDLDLFILPGARDPLVAVLTNLGMRDYYNELPYDRGWIYRAVADGTIVDLIWSMANRRAAVDEAWLTRGPELEIRGERVRVLPVEEMIWAKLYVFHHDRCDWTDVWNLLYAAGPTLDWEYLLARVAEDWRLLAGALSAFAWLCPGRATALPAWLWDRLRLPAPEAGATPDADRHRADLLDTRPWLIPTLREGETPFGG